MTPDLVKQLSLNSAAAEASEKPSGHLLTIDTRWTDTLAYLYEVADHVKLGVIVSASLQHDGKEKVLKVKPRARL